MLVMSAIDGRVIKVLLIICEALNFNEARGACLSRKGI
jgi:hypothetical protein